MAPEENNEPPLTRNFKDNPYPNQNQNIINNEIDADSKSYSLSGKIMLSAIILLFFVVILMLCLHIYARWYLRRARRRQLRRHRRRSQLVFHNDAFPPVAVSRGLDATVLASLPVFSYHPKIDAETAPECAVCLSEFEPGETGRILPKCNHSFHTECIDMWFHSHDTCPLCRAPVERAPEPEIIITVCEPEPETGSGSVNDENRTASSSSGSRKPSLIGVTVEVPAREDGFRDELESSSFRSPMSRMLSFTRILSRERRGNVSPSSCGVACSSAAECGAERSEREETQ